MKRISNIDITRGIVMVIMALDHVRDFMHINSLTQSPTNLQTTSTALFFTRWITHLCAPTFVFLSGVSAYISLNKAKNISSSRSFLLKRGLWLILLEFTIINFALWFDVGFHLLIMEVICAIGFGFVVLSLLLPLRPYIIGIAGVIIIFAHDLMQTISFAGRPVANFLYSVLFAQNLITVSPNFSFLVGYPLIPWVGVIMAGFGCGKFFELNNEKRKRLFFQIGGAALALFCIIRFFNFYGDTFKWATQKNNWFTFLSFINVTKYPPSLLFCLLFLGIMFLLLAITNNMQNRFTKVLMVYGKVPLFYFIVHLYLIHILMLIMLFMQGYGWKDFSFGLFKNGRPDTPSGVGLPLIYITWAVVVILLYPLCKWYGKYKEEHKEKKWLRYL